MSAGEPNNDAPFDPSGDTTRPGNLRDAAKRPAPEGPFVPLHDFRSRMGKGSKAEFVARHPHPVLLLEKKEGDFGDAGFQTVAAKPGAIEESSTPDTSPDLKVPPEALPGSRTPTAEKHADIAKKLAESGSSEMYVCTLQKRDPNKFASMITVGRAANNDIRINLPSVSKFHAYFTHIPRDQLWFLTDANSSNGTWVDGERLKKERGRAKLSNGCAIRIGPDVLVRFFEAGDLYDYLLGTSR